MIRITITGLIAAAIVTAYSAFAGDHACCAKGAANSHSMTCVSLTSLNLTADQKTKIEQTFENHRQAILSTTDQLEKDEALLARLLDAEPVDRNAVFTQIDRVIQARSEMERASAVMTLEMRGYLTRAQWEQLPRTNLTIGTTGLSATTRPRPASPAVPGKRGTQ